MSQAAQPPAGLEPYREELPYTYAFGHFAALEALTHRPGAVAAVLAHHDLPPRWRDALVAAADRAGKEVVWHDATVARLRRHAQVTCLAQVVKSADLVAPCADHIALVAPSHAGNVGSALRSLAGFGFDDVVLVAPRVDVWGPHVIRASVGLRFALRCQVVESVEGYLSAFAGRHHYLFSADGDTELRDARFGRPATLWFGPEWAADDGRAGAPPGAQGVRIGTHARVESLNLAVAVSLAAYHASQTTTRLT